MRNFVYLPILFIAFVVSTLALPSGNEKLQIGADIPKETYKMKEISGKDISLAKAMKKNGLLVIFSCNTCPYVIAWENRYNDIAAACRKNGIGLILVNSNEAQRDEEDSFDAMVEHAKEKKYNQILYSVDANHVLADAFGADRTPEVFLFNGNKELVYTGAIDNNSKNASAVTERYLMDAITAMVKGEKPAKQVSKSLGCSIKRVS